MKVYTIMQRVVKQISQEYNIPEEEVWVAVRKLKEKSRSIKI
ncbi:hypothetical protein [Archaeoglobus profundus]|uniref:Uncharacterized protein n=1 Tax=Archaeoglobus profundus (strain DSM 5631 / JCM 9629 / NBRC 100127 / Av18) TaxID=572546 RepID=D2RDK6_ARCPA|nr:hypothetical protein [Archaeoglobus profundus]ADB58200.1 hypothetical protein Arcpr_1144 [Archaeoglobus profundus DSM 5631]